MTNKPYAVHFPTSPDSRDRIFRFPTITSARSFASTACERAQDYVCYIVVPTRK